MARDEQIPVLVTEAGDPTEAVDLARQTSARIVAVTATVRHAVRAERAGVDIVICTGSEAGGKVSEVSTLPLIPQVVDAVRVPVVAGGGIADRRGVAAALALGAKGVQMGTRFMATVECDLHESAKQSILAAGDLATVVTGRLWNQAIRVLRNQYSEQVALMERNGATLMEYLEYCDGKAEKAWTGNIDQGQLPLGEVCGLIHDIPTCRDLVVRIFEEVMATIESLAILARRPD